MLAARQVQNRADSNVRDDLQMPRNHPDDGHGTF